MEQQNFFAEKFKRFWSDGTIFYIFIALIIIVGITIRTIVLGYRTEFEDDETRLLLAMSDKNLFGMFLPLSNAQSAPPVYLILLKIFHNLAGGKEQIVKILPYFFSLGSMFMFFKLSMKFFQNKYSVILANLLFSINLKLIYYSSVIKQYSADVFVCLCFIYLIYDKKLGEMNKKELILISLLTVISSFVSLPSLFFIGGYIIFCLWEYFKTKFSINRFLVFVPFFALYITYYFIVLIPSKMQMSILFPKYWDGGFITLNNFFTVISANLAYHFLPNNYILFLLIMIILGIYFCIREKSRLSLLLILSFVLVLCASGLKMYPILDRVALYLVPVYIFFIVKPIDAMKVKNVYFVLVCLIFTLSFSGYISEHFKTKIINSDTYINNKPLTLMKELKRQYNYNTDIILLNEASQANFKYYSNRENLQNVKFIVLPFATFNDSELLMEYLNNLPQNQRYWIYLSKEYPKKEIFPTIEQFISKQKIIFQSKHSVSRLILFVKEE